MRPFTHVIFDMDGVLLDTERLYTEVSTAVLAEFGKRFDWTVKREIMGRSPNEAAERLVRALNLPISAQEYLDRSAPLLERAFQNTAPVAGAEQVVLGMAERGVPMAIATSTARRLFALKSAPHDWFRAFSVVVCGDDPRIRAFKPAPDIFLVAAEDLGAAPEACLVFEDSIAGVEGAIAAGMQVIALPDPNNDRSRFSAAHRVIEAHSELELPQLLQYWKS